jgi:UDP-glucose 4,6-dehydratase
MEKLSKIIITGGCGFIGSHMVNYFVNKYPTIHFYNIDKMYYCANEKNVTVSNKPNYKFIKGDICDMSLISFLLEEYKIDAILHFAAQSHVDNSFSNSLEYTRDNVMGTHILLEASRLYGKLKLFFHVSTDEVYGESIIGASVQMHEDSELNPTNPYAATKAGAEALVKAYHNSYNLPVMITRCNNVYGDKQYPEKLIPRFVNLLKNNEKCTIHGQGTAHRSFIHVDDVCDAFDCILNKGTEGQIYNIGSKDEFSVLEIAKIIIEIIKPKDSWKDWIVFVRDRDFNDQRYLINADKLIKLGWSQKIRFYDIIEKVVQWYVDCDSECYWNVKRNSLV